MKHTELIDQAVADGCKSAADYASYIKHRAFDVDKWADECHKTLDDYHKSIGIDYCGAATDQSQNFENRELNVWMDMS